MTRRLPTGSSLDRAWHCPESQRLPHVYRGNRWSRRGSKTHAFMRKVWTKARERMAAENVGEAEALADAIEEALAELGDDPARALWEAIPFDQLPAGGSLEIALAWDYETGEARVLHSDGDRDYSEHE
jgi:hypothetical protein